MDALRRTLLILTLLQDCGQVVASKFFTVNGPPLSSSSLVSGGGSTPSGSTPPTNTASTTAAFSTTPHAQAPLQNTDTQAILCETDYFRRLDLLCHACAQPLRGPHVKALGYKFHLEHFTCSVCPAAFGANDTYYERDGAVYCATHFARLFAAACGGCGSAVLRNFVEVTRKSRSRDDSGDRVKRTECWHPECYMIYKLWSIRLLPLHSSQKPSLNGPDPGSPSPVSQVQAQPQPQAQSQSHPHQHYPLHPHPHGNPHLHTQTRPHEMDLYQKATAIFQVLSAFEESSASCMTEMLIHFSNQQYNDGILEAYKFISHIEILFMSIDSIELSLSIFGDKTGLQHTREPKQLAKKIVHFFSLLSQSKGGNVPRSETTKDLISLVTGLAHTLKVLIRAALNGALKLVRFLASTSTLSFPPSTSNPQPNSNPCENRNDSTAQTSLSKPSSTNSHPLALPLPPF